MERIDLCGVVTGKPTAEVEFERGANMFHACV